MLWIKRNLFLVIGGLVALGLLAWSFVFFYGSYSKYKGLEQDLEQGNADLKRLYELNPFPAQTNIDAAKREQARVREMVTHARKYFTPVPYKKVSGQDFKTLLEDTLYELRTKASQSGVRLPGTSYYFTFELQRKLVKFAEGSFPALPQRLAEITILCNLLFESKVNELVELRREKLSADDTSGTADFHELTTQTNAATGAVQTPYELSFVAFSSDLAKVLENIARSPYGMVAKVLMVESPPEVKDVRPGPAPPPPATRAGAAAEPATILNEKRLKITLQVDLVKAPAP